MTIVFSFYPKLQCVKWKSLLDYSEEKLKGLEGSLSFSRLVNFVGNERIDDKYYQKMDFEGTQWSPYTFIIYLDRSLKKAMNLYLFNFDLI